MNKKILAVVVVAILLVAGVAAAVYALNQDDDSDDVKVTGNLPVFGNANNDDYMDSRDIDVLKDIIDKGTWDKEAYPYADANQDGSITQDDIDLVNKIIADESCTLYYLDFENKVTEQSFPVACDRICINRYFFAEVVDILGLFDHIVLASTKLTEDRSHMYDMSHIETSYEGSKAPTAELILDNDIDLIIADSWDTKVCKTAQEGDPSINAFYVDIYSYGNLVRFVNVLGLFVGAEERATKYASFVNEINDYIQKGMEGQDKLKIAITYLGSTISAGNTTIECAPCSSTYLLSDIADCYYSDEKSSRNNRYTVSDEWMINNYGTEYEAVVAMHEYTDTTKVNGTFYTPQMFNERVEQLAEKYSAIPGLKTNVNLISTSFFSITFGSYAHVPMIAALLYPDNDNFSTEKGWDYLQKYWDEFSSVNIDVRTQGGWFYTGD